MEHAQALLVIVMLYKNTMGVIALLVIVSCHEASLILAYCQADKTTVSLVIFYHDVTVTFHLGEC